MTTPSDGTGAHEQTPSPGCPEKSVVHRYLDVALRPPVDVHVPPPDVAEFLGRMARNRVDDPATGPEHGDEELAFSADRPDGRPQAGVVTVRRDDEVPAAGPGRWRRPGMGRRRCAPTVLVLSLAVASMGCAGVVAGVAVSSWVPPVAANVISLITATTLGLRTILGRRAHGNRSGGVGRDEPEPSGPVTPEPDGPSAAGGDGLAYIYDQLRSELKVRPVPDTVDLFWVQSKPGRLPDPAAASGILVDYAGPVHVAAEVSNYLQSPAATALWLDYLVDEYRRSSLRVSCEASSADVSAEHSRDLYKLAVFRSVHRLEPDFSERCGGRRSIVWAAGGEHRSTVRKILLDRLGSAVRERVGARSGEREEQERAGKFFVAFDFPAPVLRRSTRSSSQVNILVWAHEDEWTVVREANGERTTFISSRAGVFSGMTDLEATAKVAAELMSVPDSWGQAGWCRGTGERGSAIECR